jgi:hypothetical protein
MDLDLGRRTLCRGLLIYVQPGGELFRMQQGSPGRAFQGDQIGRVQRCRQGCRVERGGGHDEGVLFSGYAATYPAAAASSQAIKKLPVACTRELSLGWAAWR